MSPTKFPNPLRLFTLLAIGLILFTTVSAQKMDGIERDRMKTILKTLKGEIKKNYYDPNFRGIDIDARFQKAEARLNEVTTSGQAIGVIAQALVDFNDSHLYFLPPSTNYRVEYGYRLRMIGDKCFVIAVKPGSDASKQGLKVGDQITGIEGFRPTRADFWKMEYFFNIVGKRQRIKLTAISPGETQPRDYEIAAEVRKLPVQITAENLFVLNEDSEENDNVSHLFRSVNGISIWRMPAFDLDPSEVDTVMKGKLGNATSVIIDLRSNGGGAVKTLESLAGYFFEKDMKIAELKGRKAMDPMTLKARPDRFKGKVVVLLSSESGSASEIFARLIQLEKRGVVLGDVSSGAVMQARRFSGETGSGQYLVFYGASITNADVIMSDGKSIEGVGVKPDELILPTGEDLAKGRDPVMSRAIEILGGQVSPDEAGKFFPYDWRAGKRIVNN